MPNLLIKRGNDVFEITGISIQDIKELVGLNGNGKNGAHIGIVQRTTEPTPKPTTGGSPPDYLRFFRDLSRTQKVFFSLLKSNPDGVFGSAIISPLGFSSTRQIGGLIAGGIAKHAKKYGVDLDTLYSSEPSMNGGVKDRLFKPGANIIHLPLN